MLCKFVCLAFTEQAIEVGDGQRFTEKDMIKKKWIEMED